MSKTKKTYVSGVIRRMDSLGRVVIPVEMRRLHQLDAGVQVSVEPTKEGILLCRYRPEQTIEMTLQDLIERLNTEELPHEQRSALMENIRQMERILKE